MIQSTGKGSHAVEGDCKPIGFTKKESSEIKKFIDFKDGSIFNFSQDEIKRIQIIDSRNSAVRDKVTLLLRRILVKRYQSYFTRGLEAVKPYDIGQDKRSLPRRELTVAIGSIKLPENHFLDFFQPLLKYQEEAGKRIKNEFYWFKNKMDNRPAFQLSITW